MCTEIERRGIPTLAISIFAVYRQHVVGRGLLVKLLHDDHICRSRTHSGGDVAACSMPRHRPTAILGACIELTTQSKVAGLGRGLPSTLNRAPAQREPSGAAYTMFTPQQVKQFKEAFNMMDQNGDGRIDEKDLKEMLTSLGGYELLHPHPAFPLGKHRRHLCLSRYDVVSLCQLGGVRPADNQAKLPLLPCSTVFYRLDPEARPLPMRRRRPASTLLSSLP